MTKKNACINALALTLCIFGSSVADVPLPIQVISGDEIGELPDQSEERILITGSRVGLRRQPRGITIRGSNDGSNIAGGRVLVNGVEVLGNGDAGATHVDTDVGLIPIEFIDRIEVLKGPAASLYGVAAKAPVVNVVTNDSYRGFDVRGSWVLNDLQLALGSSWFSLQSKEQCDVTNGALQPSWSFFSKHNYGLPGFSSDGGTLFLAAPTMDFSPALSSFRLLASRLDH